MTLNDRLKEEGFDLVECILNIELPDKLPGWVVELARGKKYSDIRIIPGDLALEEDKWIPVEPSHFIYAKLTGDYRKKLEEDGPTLFNVSVLCKDVKTGEKLFQQHFMRSYSKKED